MHNFCSQTFLHHMLSHHTAFCCLQARAYMDKKDVLLASFPAVVQYAASFAVAGSMYGLSRTSNAPIPID